MSREKERLVQTIRFMDWTKRYSGWWQLICTPDDQYMNFEMMQMLIKQLAKEELYEIIFVLLEVHKNEDFVKSLQSVILKDLLISEWRKGKKEKIIRKLIMHLE